MPKSERPPERWMRKFEVDNKGETSFYAKEDWSGKENNFEGYSAKKKAMILRARRRIRLKAAEKAARRTSQRGARRQADRRAEDIESWREFPRDLKPELKELYRACRGTQSAIAHHMQNTELSPETYALARDISEKCLALWQTLETLFFTGES